MFINVLVISMMLIQLMYGRVRVMQSSQKQAKFANTHPFAQRDKCGKFEKILQCPVHPQSWPRGFGCSCYLNFLNSLCRMPRVLFFTHGSYNSSQIIQRVFFYTGPPFHLKVDSINSPLDPFIRWVPPPNEEMIPRLQDARLFFLLWSNLVQNSVAFPENPHPLCQGIHTIFMPGFGG